MERKIIQATESKPERQKTVQKAPQTPKQPLDKGLIITKVITYGILLLAAGVYYFI